MGGKKVLLQVHGEKSTKQLLCCPYIKSQGHWLEGGAAEVLLPLASG